MGYKELLDELISLKIDEQKAAEVKDISIKRDVGVFKLNSGKIYFCKPVKEKIIAAVFFGDGVFSFAPPTKVEREQLFRFTEKETFSEKFNFLLMLFTDQTQSELTSKLSFQQGSFSKANANMLIYALDYFTNEDKTTFDYPLINTILNNGDEKIFYGYFSDDKTNPYLFRILADDDEPIEFFKRSKNTMFHDFELINKFAPHPEDLKSHLTDSYSVDEIAASNYEISVEFDDDLEFKSVAKFSLLPLKKDHYWIRMYLYKKLKVDSIILDNVKNTQFYRPDDESELWIRADSTFKENIARPITIYYHGDLLEKNQFGWIYMKSSSGWYPRIYGKTRSYYKLNYKFPDRYKLASIGKLVSEKTVDDFSVSTWVTPTSVKSASFNIGNFKEYLYHEENFPDVKIYMFDGGHKEISSILTPMGILSSSEMDKAVGRDVVNSISFYNTTFGNIQFQDNIYATEIPYLHGEAFQDLIHFSWLTFQGINSLEEDLMFRAHEIAHQWWGVKVGFQSYHDQWLSEGFAEYSGLWFMQTVLKDNSKFFKILDDWKNEILENRVYLFGKGQEAGPIWLGHRTSGENTEGDYGLIIYKKGAWVLHMLRNLLLDLKTLSDDRFKAMMKEFFVTYTGLNPSTNDFKILVDKYCGEDMTWFFNNWVYGTSVPNYKFAYNIVKQKDGMFTLILKTRQENVDSTFSMLMPIVFDFGDGRTGKIRIEIKDEKSEISIKNLPAEPKEIIFNYLNSVLCEYEVVDYEDI